MCARSVTTRLPWVATTMRRRAGSAPIDLQPRRGRAYIPEFAPSPRPLAALAGRADRESAAVDRPRNAPRSVVAGGLCRSSGGLALGGDIGGVRRGTLELRRPERRSRSTARPVRGAVAAGVASGRNFGQRRGRAQRQIGNVCQRGRRASGGGLELAGREALSILRTLQHGDETPHDPGMARPKTHR